MHVWVQLRQHRIVDQKDNLSSIVVAPEAHTVSGLVVNAGGIRKIECHAVVFHLLTRTDISPLARVDIDAGVHFASLLSAFAVRPLPCGDARLLLHPVVA